MSIMGWLIKVHMKCSAYSHWWVVDVCTIQQSNQEIGNAPCICHNWVLLLILNVGKVEETLDKGIQQMNCCELIIFVLASALY